MDVQNAVDVCSDDIKKEVVWDKEFFFIIMQKILLLIEKI